MATTIQISSVNYSGQTAEITYYPDTGGTVNLGYQILPYTFSSDYYYGTYDLFFSAFSKTCSSQITNPVSFLLQEDSFFLLQEDGNYIELES